MGPVAAPGYTAAVSRGGILREVLGVYALLALVTWGVTHVPSSMMREYGHVVLAASFLYAALTMARREPAGARRFGIDLSGMLEASDDEQPGISGLLATLRTALPELVREFFVALGFALLIFPIFALGFRLFHGVTQPFTFQPPREPLDFVLGQLLVVALPEEALFRGYVQTRLTDAFPRRVRLLGAAVSPVALVLQSVLFALLHFVVAFDPSRLAVFFPGLAFGYLRALRGGIGAAIWFHAMSNLLSELLTRGYL